MTGARETWDVLCRVVDNYGDVGIAWRLARELATDARREVRLVVDGLASLARIAPAVDAARVRQPVGDVEVADWSLVAGPQPRVADVVIELLGCGLPDGYLDAMTRRPVVWIDFEHLSAERWVDDFHGQPSPQPSRPLVKHFFYPGFGERTGGLLTGAFGGTHADDLFERLGIDVARDEALVSLFAYPDAPVGALLDALAADASRRWRLIVPTGVLTAPIDRWLGASDRRRGGLSVTTIPFVDQDDYDRLLAACDVNFVRGEDSFVRAQVAGHPFVWHIYRQPEGAHLAKLAAFEDRYEAGLDFATAAAQRAFWQAWNAPDGDVAGTVGPWLGALPTLRAAAGAWRATLRAQTSLVDRLAAFVAARRTSP